MSICTMASTRILLLLFSVLVAFHNEVSSLSIVSSESFIVGSPVTIRCGADAIDLPTNGDMYFYVRLSRQTYSLTNENSLNAKEDLFLLDGFLLDDGAQEYSFKYPKGTDWDIQFPTKEELNDHKYQRDLMVGVLTIPKTTCQDSVHYFCEVVYRDGGFQTVEEVQKMNGSVSAFAISANIVPDNIDGQFESNSYVEMSCNTKGPEDYKFFWEISCSSRFQGPQFVAYSPQSEIRDHEKETIPSGACGVYRHSQELKFHMSSNRDGCMIRCEFGQFPRRSENIVQNHTFYLKEGTTVRLIGGSSPSEGRVEVQRNGAFGTVCDDSWDDNDAAVICRMLGYSGGKAWVGSHYGQGSGPIWLDDVNCIGDEEDVFICQHRGWGIEDCDHTEDAGVSCQVTTTVRLIGGSSLSEGRVEIQRNGAFGAVCDDYWDDKDAAVICRMLGYSGGKAVIGSHYGQGSGSIWLDNVNCTGDEKDVFLCQHRGWGIEDCDHTEYAAVSCQVSNSLEFSVAPAQPREKLVESVQFSCTPGKDTDRYKKVIGMGIKKEDEMIAVLFAWLSHVMISSKDLETRSQAKGLVSKIGDLSRSYLNLSLMMPVVEDSGEYVCYVSYERHDGTLTTDSKTVSLKVQELSGWGGQCSQDTDCLEGLQCSRESRKCVCLVGTSYSSNLGTCKNDEYWTELWWDFSTDHKSKAMSVRWNFTAPEAERDVMNYTVKYWKKRLNQDSIIVDIIDSPEYKFRDLEFGSMNIGNLAMTLKSGKTLEIEKDKYFFLCYDTQLQDIQVNSDGDYSRIKVTWTHLDGCSKKVTATISDMDGRNSQTVLLKSKLSCPTTQINETDECVLAKTLRAGSSYRVNITQYPVCGKRSIVYQTTLYTDLTCQTGSFKCTSGKCIDGYRVCNGDRDCPDGDDESSSFCTAPTDWTCKTGRFKCTSGKCIYDTDVCNGYRNCQDGEDESSSFCTYRTCQSDRFKCASGRCIPYYWVCNGNRDCPDGQDESSLFCLDLTCQTGYFKCTSGKCIYDFYVCDGDRDCPDGDDESSSFCTDRTCQTGSFKCTSGRCIRDYVVCDGDRNCPDGDDESSSFCTGPDRTCQNGLFKCTSGLCIPDSMVCDGYRQCPDGDDESLSLCTGRTCQTGRFKCTSGKCIYDSSVCNGRRDCPDGDDESSSLCTDQTCETGWFKCTSGKCIYDTDVCDGYRSCPNGEDESSSFCTGPDRTCQSGRLKCTSGKCISVSFLCNGRRDCPDGEDESSSFCSSPDRTCQTGRLKCTSGKCIYDSMMCDGDRDCLDGEDESSSFCTGPDEDE